MQVAKALFFIKMEPNILATELTSGMSGQKHREAYLMIVYSLFFSLFEREVESQEEERGPGSHHRGQEEEKEEGGQEGKSTRCGGRDWRRWHSGGREGLKEKEREGEEEEKEQVSRGEDGRRALIRGWDPATGAPVWAEDGAVRPGLALNSSRVTSASKQALRTLSWLVGLLSAHRLHLLFQMNLNDTWMGHE